MKLTAITAACPSSPERTGGTCSRTGKRATPSEFLERWGIEQSDVPAVALETQPGDVVAFNHNLMHASCGGSTRRRMFTLNCCAHTETDQEIEELKQYIANHHRYWIDQMHSDVMRGTASPARMRPPATGDRQRGPSTRLFPPGRAWRCPDLRMDSACRRERILFRNGYLGGLPVFTPWKSINDPNMAMHPSQPSLTSVTRTGKKG